MILEIIVGSYCVISIADKLFYYYLRYSHFQEEKKMRKQYEESKNNLMNTLTNLSNIVNQPKPEGIEEFKLKHSEESYAVNMVNMKEEDYDRLYKELVKLDEYEVIKAIKQKREEYNKKKKQNDK